VIRKTVGVPISEGRPFVTTRLAFVASLVAVLWLAGTPRIDVTAAEPKLQSPSAQPPGAGMQEMMKMHEQMMAEMKAGDARLDALVTDMNAASGDAKVTAIAAVVTELVRQHKAMHERMGQMHQRMMDGRGMMMKR
jgi:hypothetical protein